MGTGATVVEDVGMQGGGTQGRKADDVTGSIPNSSLLSFSDSPFLDDDSWAEPPRAADRRLKIAAAALGLSVLALTFFTLGAKLGKSRGTTVVVLLAGDTSVGRRKKQTAKNIAVGDEISVRGVTGDDGSIAATAATVGDIEIAAVPTGIASGAGQLGVDPLTPAQADVGSAVATSSVAVAGATAAGGLLPSTTLPTLGGLLPG